MKNLPAVLSPMMEKPQWVLWKWVLNDTGRWTKPPYQAQHPTRYASTTDKETWSSYEIAYKNAPSDSDGGIGFVLRGSGIGAIDIDDCVEDNGQINEVTQYWIRRSKSYCEITPSRRGVRIIGLTRGETLKQEHVALGEGSHAEVYRDCNRFITVTGLQTDNYSRPLHNIDGIIEELVEMKHKAKSLNGHGKDDVDSSPSGLFFRQVMKWYERGWDVDRMVNELVSHPNKYAHTSLKRYLGDGRDIADEVTRAIINKGLSVRSGGSGFEFLSGSELVKGFQPPDYLIEGLLQRGFLYSLTGRTGSGKTSIMLLLAALVGGYKGYGKKAIVLDDREIERGRVVYFAGENPDDVRMRWIAMAEYMGFDFDELDVHFVLGRCSLAGDIDAIREKVNEVGGCQLVIVDTAVAYFEGDDENSNAQMSVYGREYLRPLTTLLGHPCVVVACHPTKNVAEDNLQPRGGGAFVAEMDTNLVVTRHDDFAELSWQTKIRGPDFNPIKFRFIEVKKCKLLVDSRGRHIRTVVCKVMTDEKYEEAMSKNYARGDDVLRTMIENPRISLAGIATKLKLHYEDGRPNKSLVQRISQQLISEKMLRKVRGRWVPTKAAKNAGKAGDTALQTQGA